MMLIESPYILPFYIIIRKSIKYGMLLATPIAAETFMRSGIAHIA
jgi:hypothetical protein